jgi:hypothetical protein
MCKTSQYYFLVVVFLIAGCKTESPVSNNENETQTYNNVLSISSGNVRYEVYSATADSFVTGYNDIGIKVFEDNAAKTTGYAKFKVKMYHNYPANQWHGSPVSPMFLYDANKAMFMGYTSFLMANDTSMFWVGFFSYNDGLNVDSVFFNVRLYSLSKVVMFTDQIGGFTYFLTLVKPYFPAQGMNTFQCLLHQTDNDKEYRQMDSVQMFIKPWMESMGHGSPNNENPVFIGGGIYEGKVNFNMSGTWYVYDSVWYQNRFITPSPPPKFIFDVP